MDPLFGRSLAALRRKHIPALGITCCLQIVKEWLAHLVDEIDIAPLASLVPNMEPSHLGTDVGMYHLQPGHITHPASYPIDQCKKRSASSVVRLLNECSQDKALIFGELSRSQHLLSGKVNSSGRIA